MALGLNSETWKKMVSFKGGWYFHPLRYVQEFRIEKNARVDTDSAV